MKHRSKEHDDAYGKMMWDYHVGKGGQELVERDDGWIGTSMGPAGYFLTYKQWQQHERDAMKYVRGRVLDVGCGPGRHAIHLQGMGFDVVGIDTSPLAVKVAKARGLRKARVMKFTDVSKKLGQFGTILMMGSNFGLFANLHQARRMLKRLHRLTTDDARIVAESADPYDTKNPYHLAYHKRNRKRGRFSCQLKIRVRYQTLIGEWFEYLKVSRDEMKQILKGTGWRMTRTLPKTGTIYVAVIEKE